MAKENETVADIIAEMRARENLDGGDMVDNFDINIGEYGGWDALMLIKAYADRFDAAHKREMEAVGNAAKLREALKLYDRIIQDRTLICDCDVVYGARTLARAALAAPPRNCDVGSAEEQAKRLHRFCISQDCVTCPCNLGKADGRCEFAWMQMPYKEGGAK